MTRAIRSATMWLILGVGLGGPAAADQPEDVTLCVTSTVPFPAPTEACFAAEGEWSASGGIVGGGSELVNCLHFNGVGVSVGIIGIFTDESGDSISLAQETILDWQNLGDCQVPDPNPCGLSCDDLYNAREGQWQITGGTGQWANLQGEGSFTSIINREYDGEGLCPLPPARCSSGLCDLATGMCFRRVAHGYLSGRAHHLKLP